MYKGSEATLPPEVILDLDTAIVLAGHYLPSCSKVEILVNRKTVIKTIENSNPPVVASTTPVSATVTKP